MSISRRVLSLLALVLPACLGGCAGGEIALAAEGASVAVFGRDVVDIGVSAITGRDCSVVRLDRQQTYCAPREHLPPPPPLCSRTLADVVCWANPEALQVRPRQIADTPDLTKEQVLQVESRWPKTLNLFGP